MKDWFRLLRARTLLLFSAAVVVVGLLPLVYFGGLLAWQFDVRLEGGPWVKLPAALMFTDHALLQGGKAAPVLAYVPQLDWVWSTRELTDQLVDQLVALILDKLHVGAVPALIGCGIIAVGISGVMRQRVLIRIQKDRNKDRVRRIAEYQRDVGRGDAADGRMEPFIGAGTIARQTDRRVA
jgi:hypothetical protein